MTDRKSFYITTPIYYVNGVPHVGSATTTLLADAFARYHRQQGESVFFLTGTDEHAQKVSNAAAKAGMKPLEMATEYASRFRETWAFLDVTNDDFIRTTEERHKRVVCEVFRQLRDRGDIYPGKYEGWYAVADETYYRDSEVKDGRAIDSGAVVERVTEDNYYFKLSAYEDRLLAYIEANPDFLMPDTRRNEVLAFIKGGLRDIAISRPNVGWGIETPGDPSQVIYVWFDAVINYLTATGWPDAPDWDTKWPADVHLVGKEIYTRFHATLWPAMLMALSLPLPNHVLGHGWWLINKVKGSKSENNIPTPQQAAGYLAERSGAATEVCVDALRYYLIRDIKFTDDADFSLEALTGRYNSDLANDLGNLLNRTLNMVHQYRGGIVPEGGAAATAGGPVAVLAGEVVNEAAAAIAALDLAGALAAIWRLVSAGNKEIDSSAPWKLNKAGDTEGVNRALYTALELNRILSVLLQPIMPHISGLIRAQLGLADSPAGPWAQEAAWGLLPEGSTVRQAQPIFPRIANANQSNQPKEKVRPVTDQAPPQPAAETPSAPAAAPATDLITIDDFIKVQLRVAEIKTAEPVPNTTKLMRLTIDVGEEAHRQLVAGIAESYAAEDLPGKKIVIVANLQPAKIRGVESNGMLLAASDASGNIVLLTPENQDIAPGSKVK